MFLYIYKLYLFYFYLYLCFVLMVNDNKFNFFRICEDFNFSDSKILFQYGRYFED